MLLFFILSGTLVDQSAIFTRQSVIKRSRSLLLPYLFCCVIFSAWRHMNEAIPLSKHLIDSLLWHGIHLPQPQLWFLPTLLLILFYCGVFSSKGLYFIPLFFGVTLVIGLASQAGVVPRYFNLDLLAISAFFYFVGIRAKAFGSFLCSGKHHILYISGLLFIALMQLSINFEANRLDLNMRVVSGAYIIPLALVLSFCFIVLASHLNTLTRGALSHLGSRSLVIFCFHYIIQGKVYRQVTEHGIGAIESLFISFITAVCFCLLIDLLIRRAPVIRYVFYGKRKFP